MIKREDYLTAVSCRSKIEEITAQVRKSTDVAEIEELTNDMKELKDREKELAEIEKRKRKELRQEQFLLQQLRGEQLCHRLQKRYTTQILRNIELHG